VLSIRSAVSEVPHRDAASERSDNPKRAGGHPRYFKLRPGPFPVAKFSIRPVAEYLAVAGGVCTQLIQVRR